MRPIAVTILLLSTLVVLSGCKKQIACDPADSRGCLQGIPAVPSLGYVRRGLPDGQSRTPTRSRKATSTDTPNKEVPP